MGVAASNAPSPSPAPTGFGTTEFRTCQSNGMIGPSTECTPGTSCREDFNGNSYGCVVCVGSGPNESNQIDTQCNPSGTVGVQTCNTDNTTWSGPTGSSICQNGNTCHNPAQKTSTKAFACDVFSCQAIDPGNATQVTTCSAHNSGGATAAITACKADTVNCVWAFASTLSPCSLGGGGNGVTSCAGQGYGGSISCPTSTGSVFTCSALCEQFGDGEVAYCGP